LRMLIFKPAQLESHANKPISVKSFSQATKANATTTTPPQTKPEAPISYVPTTEQSVQIQEPPVTVTSPTSTKPTDPWPEMITAMRLSGLTKELANHCILDSIDDEQCRLLLDPRSRSIRSARTEETLLKALQAYRGQPLKLVIHSQSNLIDDTPAIQHLKEREHRQQTAVDTINTDVNIQALQQHFGAQIIPGSIEPR
jgi:DNA polymerase III subunit gamma/tau